MILLVVGATGAKRRFEIHILYNSILVAIFGFVIPWSDEEDGAEDPIKAAKDMKKALESGGVDKMAGVGAQKAAQLGGMLGKGMGGMATKAFSLW